MKNYKVGMIMVATVLSTTFAPMAYAGTAKGASVKELMTEYAKEIKRSAFGGASSAKGLSAQASKAAQDKMIKELDISSAKANSLTVALRSNAAATGARLEALATIVAAKKLSKELSKTDPQQGKTLSEAADAAIGFLSNSYLTGARKSGTDLNAQEMALTSQALKRLENVTELLLTRFESQERESYVKILKRHDDILASGKKGSSEEALVDAIMVEKKVTKEQAMEMVKKLKDCV